MTWYKLSNAAPSRESEGEIYKIKTKSDDTKIKHINGFWIAKEKTITSVSGKNEKNENYALISTWLDDPNNTKDDIRLLKSIEWRYARDNEKMAFL